MSKVPKYQIPKSNTPPEMAVETMLFGMLRQATRTTISKWGTLTLGNGRDTIMLPMEQAAEFIEALQNIMQVHGHWSGERRSPAFAACGRNTCLIEYEMLMSLLGHYQ